MTKDQIREMQRELVHDLGKAAREAQAKVSETAQPPSAKRPSHWLGEMLHPDDTTRHGW
jgi:hypothetical protein